MKALVYTAPRRLELMALPQPGLQPGEVLVRIRAAGVCGSDLHGFLGRSKRRKPPLVLGHEFAGEVDGERVAVYPIIGCGRCPYCAAGSDNLCPGRKVYGLDMNGGLEEYVAVPSNCLFHIAKDMSFIEGSLVEPLANAIHIVSRLDVAGRTGLIYGAGPIGVLCALVAKQAGAAKLAVVDRNPHRLAKMAELGADLVVQAAEQDPVGTILNWTDGHGVHFAIDAVGNRACRQNAISVTASGGTVGCVGLEEEVCEIESRVLVVREIDLKGSYAYTRADFAAAITMLERKLLPWRSFIDEASLSEGQQVFDDLGNGRSAIIKAVFAL
jgi:L-iditol 2-dehydrogenase